jgi:hypothetical protein
MVRVPYIYTVATCASPSASCATARRILPWREVMNQEPRSGDLRIEECLDDELHRYVRTACLLDTDSVIYSDARPKLLDVRLMAMSPQAFTLTGFERVAGVEYGPSWLVANCARSESR